MIQRPSDPERLNGCGLVVVNPPYTLEGEMAPCCPSSAAGWPRGGGAGYRLDWIEPAQPEAPRAAPEAESGVCGRGGKMQALICLAQVQAITDTPRQFGRPIGPGGDC